MGLSELIHSGFTKRQASSMLASAPVVDTTALVAKATATTKGDLFTATAAGVVARLGVGADGQVLTADSSIASGLKYATLAAPVVRPSFRGAWSMLSVLTLYDFDNGVVPAEFTNSGFSVQTTSGAGAPAYTKMLNRPNTGGPAGNLSLVIPAGITQIKFWSAGQADGPDFMSRAVCDVAGANVRYLSWAWVQDTRTVTAGQVARWYTVHGNNGYNAAVQVAHIELLGASDPYMRGDAVTHEGSLYTSAIDINSATPGVDVNWTKLLIGTTP